MAGHIDKRFHQLSPDRRKVIAILRRGPTTLRRVAEETGQNTNGLSQFWNVLQRRRIAELVSNDDRHLPLLDRQIRYIDIPSGDTLQ